MTAASPLVHYFCDPPPASGESLKLLLGGKGASLSEMTRAGLRVPGGFTIACPCCAAYYSQGKRWPDGLEDAIRKNLARLEQETGRTFGQSSRPLLVSVRSGAARSMPGMMDTLLNCGLHPDLASEVGDTPAFWQVYLQFIRTFARIVHGLDESQLHFAGGGPEGPPSRALAERHLQMFRDLTGRDFPTTPWNILVECIDAVFASWNSARAVAYREKHDIGNLDGTAVNVQAMFPSEVSGIAFTQSPVPQDGGRMIVEAARGLGEAVVSGDVTPDRFLVHRENLDDVIVQPGRSGAVVHALGGQPAADNTTTSGHGDPNGTAASASSRAATCLSTAELRTIGELALKVERFYGYPVDIEWGLADGQFALLQARAIRGLDVARDVELGRIDEIHRLRLLCGGQRKVWVIHNLAETLRAPTPLTWDIIRDFMRGDGGFGRLYQQLGYASSPRVRSEGFLELIAGRIFADPERLAELFFDGLPMSYNLDELVRDKRLLDAAPTQFDPARADGRFLWRLGPNLLAMLRSSRRVAALRKTAKREFDEMHLPAYLQYVDDCRKQSLVALTPDELLAELETRITKVLHEFGPASLRPGFAGGLALARLEGRLAQLMGPAEGAALASLLTRGLEGDTTFEQDLLLYQVAKGEARLDDFLARFGHRAINEMELSESRWRENPRFVLQTIDRFRTAQRSPSELHHHTAQARDRAEQNLPSALAHWGGSALAEEIAADLAEARSLLPYRESGKHFLMMGYEQIRLVIRELAQRWELGDRIFFLQRSELARYPAERASLEGLIEGRRLRWQSQQRLDIPDVIDSRELDSLGLSRTLADADELEGQTIAAGVATGAARIVHDPREAGDLGSDYILVCPSTDPGWTPLFVAARGLVVERGGVLSHGAIVARDFGIPAVVCPDATRRLQDGDSIRVDGNRGRIVVLERNGKPAGGAHA